MLAECIFTDIRLIFELQCECQGDRQCIVLKPGMAEYQNANKTKPLILTTFFYFLREKRVFCKEPLVLSRNLHYNDKNKKKHCGSCSAMTTSYKHNPLQQ